MIILVNFYGVKKVPITATDLKKANKPITYKWMWAKLGAVAKKLGTSIDNPSTSASIVHRDGAARIVYKICRENKKMQPKK
ncbi:MAG: hypothetical protein IKF09_00820 [Clostridiales bacterium]|nr:hypothetical protein [Clostridiales bacterium]